MTHGVGENYSLLVELLKLVRPLRIMWAVAFAAEYEPMQVAVGPAHTGLKDVVQPGELQILRNEHASPYARRDFNAQLSPGNQRRGGGLLARHQAASPSASRLARHHAATLGALI